MLTLMKLLLNNTAENEQILQFYLDKAESAILNYTGRDSLDEISNGSNICVELAIHYYKTKDKTEITQMAQGSRSATYKNEEIPKSILVNLPSPRIKVL